MKYAHAIVIAVSVGIASLVLYAGVQHNPMGAFCLNENLDVCEFDYKYATIIWFSWFLPLFLIQEAIVLVAVFVKKMLTNKPGE